MTAAHPSDSIPPAHVALVRDISWQFVLLAALSVSIGWGVRGQFGHMYGAALAGALAAMVVALLAGREDWQPRIPHFAFLGAVGFAFGGGMSYMKPVGYISSSDSLTVLYGFGCLAVFGFIWAAPAGTGIALAAYLDRDRLTRLYIPICAVFAAWYCQDVLQPLYRPMLMEPLREFAGHGLNALVAMAAVLLLAAVRRDTWGMGSKLVLYMGTGWWTGYVVLVKLLGLHMNPPRSDDWAGFLGLVFGILAFCYRERLGGVGFATVATGLLGAIGFALGGIVRLLGVATGWQTNWHSVMEQWHGFFFGVAIAIVFALVARRAPVCVDSARERRWTEIFSVVFVLAGLTYLNFRRSPGEWHRNLPNLTPDLYGIPVVANLLPARGFIGWFDAIFVLIAIAMVVVLVLHVRRGVAFIPSTWLGKGQLFYLVFIWSIVSINFTHVLPRFEPARLVTEWAMAVNVVICTVLLVYACLPGAKQIAATPPDGGYQRWIRKVVAVGLLGAVLAPVAGWCVKRAIFGDSFAGGFYMDHIRFGPNNTNGER